MAQTCDFESFSSYWHKANSMPIALTVYCFGRFASKAFDLVNKLTPCLNKSSVSYIHFLIHANELVAAGQRQNIARHNPSGFGSDYESTLERHLEEAKNGDFHAIYGAVALATEDLHLDPEFLQLDQYRSNLAHAFEWFHHSAKRSLAQRWLDLDENEYLCDLLELLKQDVQYLICTQSSLITSLPAGCSEDECGSHQSSLDQFYRTLYTGSTPYSTRYRRPL